MNIVVFCLLVTVAYSAKLPSHFKKCDRKQKDFSTCLPAAVEDAVTQLTKPVKELGLPSLNPLVIPEMSISAGTNAVGLQQNFKNVNIFGITNLHCSRMDVDFEKKTIDNFCHHPKLRMESQYEMSGKILLLDIQGSGAGTITLDNVNVSVHYDMDEYKKNGEKHFKIKNVDLRMEPGKVHFLFENLFNGDKVLSDNIHKVVNENWKEVYDDVKSSYNEIFGRLTRGFFNSVLDKVSVSELFGAE